MQPDQNGQATVAMEAKREPLRVAIIAGGAKMRYFEAANYDWRWQVWGLNAIRPDGKQSMQRWRPIRWARMFNLHRFEHLNRDCYEYILADTDWAKENPRVPFYVCDSWHGLLPNEVIYPLESLHYTLPPRGGRYHAGSIDMLVALAIHEGAVEIALHGVGLALDSPRAEPISARACLEYWCGYAQGRGVEITVHPDCDLFRQYHLVASDTIYGFDDVKLLVEAADLAKDPSAYGPTPRR